MSNPTSVVLEDLLLSQVKTANYKKATVLPFCNREYEGQLKEKGDTINVIIHPNVTGTTSGASGDDIPESQYQPTKVPLTVGQIWKENLRLTDLDKVRANQNYQSIQAVQMGKALATAHDTHIFTRIAAEVHADNIIDAAGSAVGLTDSTIYGKILDLVTRLDLKDADYEPGDLALFVNPVIGNLIKKADIFDSTDIGAEKRLNGMFGMIDGVQIVRTNNMPLSSGEIPMILMTRGSCTFVEQFAGFKVTSANQGFRTNMLAENVYQAKVLGEPDQTKIAVTYCTNTSV